MQKLTISCRGTFITYDYLGGDYEEACEDLFLDLADCLASEDPVVRSLGFSEAKENFGSALWQARRDPIEGVERKRAEEVERLQLENHKLKQVAQQRQQQVEILKAALDDATKRVKEERDNPEWVAVWSNIGQSVPASVVQPFLVCSLPSGKRWCNCRGCHALCALESVGRALTI